MHPDDERLGQLARVLRRQTGISQKESARRAGIPRESAISIEAGNAGHVRLDRVRCYFDSFGGRVRVTGWWNGAAADRLLDARHAALVERVLRLLALRGWQIAAEVSFSEYGERGSIDVLGGHQPSRSLLVCEVKASIGSLEETNRVLDVKVRLAGRIAAARFGWSPRSVSRILIVPDDRTLRRVVERHRTTMDAVYPLRSREVRAWLRKPEGSISALWFLTEVADSDRIPPAIAQVAHQSTNVRHSRRLAESAAETAHRSRYFRLLTGECRGASAAP